MTLIEAFDRLRNQYVNRIDFSSGASLVCPEPSFVGFDDKDGDPIPEVWLNVIEEGLTVTFNTRKEGGFVGHEEPLSNVARIA